MKLLPTRYPRHDDAVGDVEVDDHVEWAALRGGQRDLEGDPEDASEMADSS